MSDERFNVVQFFTNDTYEYVRREVPAQEAGKAFHHYTHSVAVQAGMVARVIVTDMLDRICMEWEHGKGLVFPTPEMLKAANDGKHG